MFSNGFLILFLCDLQTITELTRVKYQLTAYQVQLNEVLQASYDKLTNKKNAEKVEKGGGGGDRGRGGDRGKKNENESTERKAPGPSDAPAVVLPEGLFFVASLLVLQLTAYTLSVCFAVAVDDTPLSMDELDSMMDNRSVNIE